MSGSDPSAPIQLSASWATGGHGGPPMLCRPSSASARWIGKLPGGAITDPKPSRKLSRSSSVIGRSAATVSSRSASIARRTRRPASSGTSPSIGCSSRRTPASTSAIAATAVMGLVSEAIRKMASALEGGGRRERRRADHVDVHLVAAGHERDRAPAGARRRHARPSSRATGRPSTGLRASRGRRPARARARRCAPPPGRHRRLPSAAPGARRLGPASAAGGRR